MHATKGRIRQMAKTARQTAAAPETKKQKRKWAKASIGGFKASMKVPKAARRLAKAFGFKLSRAK